MTEKTGIEAGAALYAAQKKSPTRDRTSGDLAKGAALYAAKGSVPTTRIESERDAEWPPKSH